MTKYKTLLTILSICFLLVGAAQVTLAFTYHRLVGIAETDTFIHDFYPAGEGIPYEQLFDRAVALQQQVSGLTVAFHALSGAAAFVIGLLLMAFAHDKAVHLFGPKAL